MSDIRVHEPRGAVRGTILAFCGFTETGEEMEEYSGLNAIADTLGLRVVYLTPTGHFWEFHRQYTLLGQETADMRLVKRALAAYGVGPVFFVGFSAGAYFINSLVSWARWFPAAVISYAGSYELAKPMSPVRCPILIFSNVNDELVRQPKTDNLTAAYVRAGDTPRVYPMAPPADYVVHRPGARMGHFWYAPGANPIILAAMLEIMGRYP